MVMGANRVSQEQLNQIIQLYKDGNTFRDIGKIVGRTHACVTKQLVKAGVYTVGITPLNAEARKKKHQQIAIRMGAGNKSEQRVHYESCIMCLAKIGFGKRMISKILKINHALASNVMKANNCAIYAKRFIQWKRQTNYAKQKRTNQRIARACRTRLRDAMRLSGKRKDYSARKLIGCTLDEFRLHIEKQFTPKMSWKNYGKYWHLDHIVPCAKFDLTRHEQKKICFHYTNYRPLCARKNMSDGARITINQQLPLPI